MRYVARNSLSLILMFGICVYLAYCFLSFGVGNDQVSAESEQAGIIGNFIEGPNFGLKQELKAQMIEQDEILEFMVWPDERRKVLLQAISSNRQLLSVEPTETTYWQRLLILQYELDPNGADMSWILSNLFDLSQWNQRSMVTLARYCVPSVFSTELVGPQACNEIIKNLPFQDDESRLAQRVGISLEDLLIVLDHYQEQS